MKELASQTSPTEHTEIIEGFSEVVAGKMLAMAGLFDIWTGEKSVSCRNIFPLNYC